MANCYPLLVVPCKRGGIPCLTPDQARAIMKEEERVISVSIFDVSEYVEPCKRAKRGFAEFCGLENFTTILTVRSPHIGMHASIPATDAGLSANHEKGRISLGMDKWKEMVLSLQPTMIVTPYDSVSTHELQVKRRRTAVGRSVKWALSADSLHAQGNWKLMRPVCAVEGKGEYIFMEELCQNETLQEYTVHIQQAVKKGQVMCAAISLPAVLMCLRDDVCFIECALPWILAEKGIGMVFDLCPTEGVSPSRYETQIDLNDDCFAEDIRPLSPDCNCYTCKRHMRAYIHHLLTVQEMNSKTLLVIHNLTRLIQLIRLYRLAGAEEREVLLNWFFAQI
ncbi:putative queuine tRNA-ribosyltransferase [Trypanosoma rangeli]|uniref:Queuine tRNA-ribosyltransferase accessory subunit 2 n=1 Tax=Trypanosoma rangeli TaxID=5698 RepID=A0A3R7K861_TRYRA|nr:putative queuine tRNA-ribosyltransferase [Trypanosoma rangeli]RNF01573.1 putative queuine tRNA-ribosyltransferase [Trypanosoma rangeli]|eukprot:RNF01573.1 putative queuine tRNA-ribosyltransferase [Trypanosoma rangeli]